jgi:hypothetical protein
MLGLLVPLVHELTAKGAAAVNLSPDSYYTEAGPIPGVSSSEDEPQWRFVVGGAQGVDVDWLVTGGGFPKRGVIGPRVAVRLSSTPTAGATNRDWCGWSEPNLLVGVTAPSDYKAELWDRFAVARRSTTGEIVIVGAVEGDPTAARTWRYSPRTETWASGYDFGPEQGLDCPISSCEDPEVPGRILLWSGAGTATYDETQVGYYSDDGGDNWVPFTRGFGVSNLAEHVGVAPRAGQDWLRWCHSASGTRQEASSDKGVTWDLVGVQTFTDYANTSRYSAVYGPKGFVCAYMTDTQAYPAVRVVESARTPLSTAEERVLESVKCGDIQLALDDDGTIYAFVRSDSGAVQGEVRVWFSVDGGYTWRKYTRQLTGFPATDVDGPHLLHPVWSMGKCHIFANNSSSDAGLICLEAGGWSNVDQGMANLGEPNLRYYRFGWVDDGGAGENGITYTPWDIPANMGWGEVATATVSLANGGRQAAAAAGQAYSLSQTLAAATAYDYACGHARIKLTAGQAVAASTTTILAVVQDAGATGYAVQIVIGTDGIRVRDFFGAATRGSATIPNMTSTWLDLRWQITHGTCQVWYRQVGTGPVWTAVSPVLAMVVTQGAAALSSVGVFITAAGAQTIITSMLAAALECDWEYGLDGPDEYHLTPSNGPRGLRWGRPIGPAELRYPCPLLGAVDSDVGYISAAGGPLLLGEEGTVPVGHLYPVEAIQPWTEPAPSVSWRSTSIDDDIFLTWGIEDEPIHRGAALALVALRASFRTAVLQIDDGAGGWTTAGTLDKGQTASYLLSGTEVRPGGTSNLTRYVGRDELAGGYFVFPPGVARRIVSNSPGYWTASATVQGIRCTVEGIDGTEDASGDAELVHPSGLLIVYPGVDDPRGLVRIRIPAGQIVPEDRGPDGVTATYDAGVLCVARVVGIGTPPDWQTQRQTALPAVISRRRDGTPSLARTGPARRTWAYSWGPSAARSMRLLAAAPDIIAASGGLPIGTWQDAWRELVATLDGLDGCPLVVVGQLPTAAGTLTDASEWLYGLATSPSLGGDNSIGGREGSAELFSIGTLVVEELV